MTAASAFKGRPNVAALLTYLAPMAERPHNYTYDPPPGVPRSNCITETPVMPVFGARPFERDISLDCQGVALLHHESVVRNFADDHEMPRVYYPEAERVLTQPTGAKRGFIFDHTVHRRVKDGMDRAPGTPRQPATHIHVDHTVKSGPRRARYFPGADAQNWLRARLQVINLWRPIHGPLRVAPLAVCDALSMASDDLVPSDLIYRDRVGEIYGVTFNPNHRWFYVPEMQPDEALLLKCCDSATDGRARFAPHTAFEDPTVGTDVTPRESIERRTFGLH